MSNESASPSSEPSSSDRSAPIIEAARSRDRGRDAVIATDVAGTIVYWNDQAAFLYGWDADEAIGKNVLDVTPTHNSSDSAAQIMEELRLGQEWTGEFIVRRRDGTPMIAHVDNFVVRDRETVIGVVGVSRPAERQTPTGTPKRKLAD
jgi:PAS domain S-box-containing protein